MGSVDETRTPREQALRRVVYLAEITVERGCAPQEQENAERAAHRLIKKWGFSLAECEEEANRVEFERLPTVEKNRRTEEALQRAAAAAARPAYGSWGMATGTTTTMPGTGPGIWFEIRF